MHSLTGKNKTKSMAYSEQGPYGAGYGPDFINAAVNRAVSSVETLGTGVEIKGFRGPMAPRISEWQERGLGRAIGVPLVLGGATIDDKFHGIIYALPFSRKGTDPMSQQSLLLFPTELNTRFLIVTPKPTFSWNFEHAVNSNAHAAGQFSALLDPSRRPYIDPSWRLDMARDPVAQFIEVSTTRHPYIRFFDELHTPTAKDQVLRHALWQAMDREVVDVREEALVARLTDEASGLLGVASDDFGKLWNIQQARKEREEKKILDALDFDPDGTS